MPSGHFQIERELFVRTIYAKKVHDDLQRVLQSALWCNALKDLSTEDCTMVMKMNHNLTLHHERDDGFRRIACTSRPLHQSAD